MRLWLSLVVVALMFAPVSAQPTTAPADAPAPAVSAADIDKLIAQLSSASFKERDAAKKALVAVGEAAMPALEKATKSSDVETQEAAAAAISLIKINSVASSQIAMTKRLVWTLPVKSGLGNRIVVAQGLVYTLAMDNSLLAVDAAKGTVRFTRTESFFRFQPPVPHGKYILVAKERGRTLQVIDADGQIKHELEDLTVQVFRHQDKVYTLQAGKPKGIDLGVLDVETGTVTVLGKAGMGHGTAVTSGDTTYFPSFTGLLTVTSKGFNLEPALKLGNVVAMAVDGDYVIGRNGPHLTCYNLKDKKLRWDVSRNETYNAAAWGKVEPTKASTQGYVSFPFAQDMGLYEKAVITPMGLTIKCFNIDDGALKWTFDLARDSVLPDGKMPTMKMDDSFTGVTIVDGVAYFGSPVGLHALDLKTHKQLWMFRTPLPVTTVPVIADGVIYFGTSHAKPDVREIYRRSVATKPASQPAAQSQPAVVEEQPKLYALKLKA